MLKCKCCKGTEFGLTVVETKVSGFRAVGGQVVEQMGEPEISTETKISFCFGCNKSITEEDTYENETCPVCGKEVEELVDGRCIDCDTQVKALANMSKEELIMMMLQGNMPKINTTNTTKEVKETKKETKKKETKKSVKKEASKETKEVKEIKEEAKEEPKKEVSDKVEIPQEEVNANLQIDDSISDNALDFSNNDEDIDFLFDDIDDDDILNQIDKVADLSELNLMDEDTVQPI